MRKVRHPVIFLAASILTFIDSPAAYAATQKSGAALPSTQAGQLISDWMKVCAAPTLNQLRKWTTDNLSSGNMGVSPRPIKLNGISTFVRLMAVCV